MREESVLTEAGRGLSDEIDRYWIRLTLIAWAVLIAWYVWERWTNIRFLALGDTDDNMRLMQVRALLDGQGWYDLRNYRLNPPQGFDIHWSRLVDLPIAGLILLLRPFAGPVWAERLACGIAPLLPLGVTMLAMGATVRRLVSPRAWPLAIVMLVGSSAAMLMFMPMRIDHHGWQLAFLALTVAGLCDPKAARGGAIVGVASAASLTVGLEMLPYCAFAGAIIALRWVWDAGEAGRLRAYALTLGGGSAIGFAVFASYANRGLRCDALTPVWLSVTVGAGVLLFALAQLSPARRGVRLGLAAAAGALLAAGFALAFPQCLGRPEQVSPELYASWLANVREAKPVYLHPFRSAFPIVTLPLIGLIGAAVGAWRARGTPAAIGWASVLLFVAFGCVMLLWQARAGPAAQMMAVPGSVALAWIVLPWTIGHRSMIVRVFGTVGGFLLVSGLFAGLAIKWLPIDRPSPYVKRVNRAGSRCAALPRLQQVGVLPAQTVFTLNDLGPRLIVTTHMNAISGPYHRNGDAILDTQHAFKGTPDQARAIMKRHGATLLLVCPNMAETTVYRSKAPGGFYDRLAHGETFDWLEPVALPKGSPFRAWAIR